MNGYQIIRGALQITMTLNSFLNLTLVVEKYATKYLKLGETIILLRKATVLYLLHTFKHLQLNTSVTLYFKLSSNMELFRKITLL